MALSPCCSIRSQPRLAAAGPAGRRDFDGDGIRPARSSAGASTLELAAGRTTTILSIIKTRQPRSASRARRAGDVSVAPRQIRVSRGDPGRMPSSLSSAIRDAMICWSRPRHGSVGPDPQRIRRLLFHTSGRRRAPSTPSASRGQLDRTPSPPSPTSRSSLPIRPALTAVHRAVRTATERTFAHDQGTVVPLTGSWSARARSWSPATSTTTASTTWCWRGRRHRPRRRRARHRRRDAARRRRHDPDRVAGRRRPGGRAARDRCRPDLIADLVITTAGRARWRGPRYPRGRHRCLAPDAAVTTVAVAGIRSRRCRSISTRRLLDCDRQQDDELVSYRGAITDGCGASSPRAPDPSGCDHRQRLV